jgi:hypothetical protein
MFSDTSLATHAINGLDLDEIPMSLVVQLYKIQYCYPMLDAFSSYMKPLKAHDILSSFTAQYSLEEAQKLKPDVLYAS